MKTVKNQRTIRVGVIGVGRRAMRWPSPRTT